jgi:hypothetical protein
MFSLLGYYIRCGYLITGRKLVMTLNSLVYFLQVGLELTPLGWYTTFDTDINSRHSCLSTVFYFLNKLDISTVGNSPLPTPKAVHIPPGK